MATPCRAYQLIAAVALAVSCAKNEAGAPPVTTADSLAVRTVYEQRVAALERGDLAGWLGVHATDVRFVDPDAADIVGTAALRAWGEPFFTQFAMKVGETVEELSVENTRAFIRYSFASEFTPKGGGAAISSHGKGLLLLRKEAGGSWQVTHNIWNAPAGLPK